MATAPSTVGGPQSHTIRNHAAFIWSVADLLRGSGQHSLGSDEGSVDFMLPDIEMSHGANPVGVQRLENHALDLHRRYEGSRIRDLPDHDVRVHLGWVEGYASEVGQPLGESVRMDAVKRAARGGAAGYFDMKAFGDQGAACAEYLKSGREVAIEGRLHSRRSSRPRAATAPRACTSSPTPSSSSQRAARRRQVRQRPGARRAG